MNIEKAFDSLPKDIFYRRKIELDTKNNFVAILDDSNAEEVVLNFITYFEPAISEDEITLGSATMSFSGNNGISYEELPITDERLKTAWDHNLYRIFVKTSKKTAITIR